MHMVDLNTFGLQELSNIQPIILQTFTLQMSGLALLMVFMVVGGYIGWTRGLRSILTVAFLTIVAYILTVRGGDQIVGIVNRFYTNGPKLAAFAIGQDPDTVAALDPLITADFQVPLFFRFLLFVGLVIVGFVFNAKSPWYAAKKERLSPLLGGFTGALTAVLLVDALATFWRQFTGGGGGGLGFVGTILSIIPDISVFVPSLIAIFFIILGVIILFNLPKVWKA